MRVMCMLFVGICVAVAGANGVEGECGDGLSAAGGGWRVIDEPLDFDLALEPVSTRRNDRLILDEPSGPNRTARSRNDVGVLPRVVTGKMTRELNRNWKALLRDNRPISVQLKTAGSDPVQVLWEMAREFGIGLRFVERVDGAAEGEVSGSVDGMLGFLRRIATHDVVLGQP